MIEAGMKQQLILLLKAILSQMGISDVVPDVEISDDPAHGEYTTNVAMRLSKQLKKQPMDIALQAVDKLKAQVSNVKAKGQNQNIYQKDQKTSDKEVLNKVLQAIDRVEVVAPGFVNIFLTEAKLGSQIVEVLEAKEGNGKSQRTRPERSRRVVVEFTDPNPFKEFHIGHLYSNSVGESLCRLLEAQGHSVRRVNYQGDVGMHVAKALWALLRQVQSSPRPSSGRAKFKVQSLETKPLTERVKLLGEAYAEGAKAFEADPKAAEEMKSLNRLIFIAAQELAVEAGGKSVVNYRGDSEVDEKELEEVKKLYAVGRAWSLEYFETIYQRLGTKFEEYYFEGQVGEYGIRLVREFTKKGVFEESEGAVVYRGEKKGLHTRVFINQLGLPTYEAKELGLAVKKYEDWPYDQSVIVTGKEIVDYFKVLIAALSEVNPDLAKKTVHLGHGMVRGSDGEKLSSRKGNVLTGEGLLEEVKQRIYHILQKSASSLSSESPQKVTPFQAGEVAEKVAVGAVKYSLLKISLPSDISFDIEKSVSLEGDSGPYLQYTYARARSVLRKSQISIFNNQHGKRNFLWSLNAEERGICRLVLYFPEVVAEAARALAPNKLCEYLIALASAFNLFYAKHPILEKSLLSMDHGLWSEKDNAHNSMNHELPTKNPQSAKRIALTAATAQVLANGLMLLGIPVVERM